MCASRARPACARVSPTPPLTARARLALARARRCSRASRVTRACVSRAVAPSRRFFGPIGRARARNQVYLKPISRLPRRACSTARSPGARVLRALTSRAPTRVAPPTRRVVTRPRVTRRRRVSLSRADMRRAAGMRSRATCSPACSRNCSSSPRSAGCTATSSSSRRARSSCMARRARSGSRPSRTTIFACAQTNVRAPPRCAAYASRARCALCRATSPRRAAHGRVDARASRQRARRRARVARASCAAADARVCSTRAPYRVRHASRSRSQVRRRDQPHRRRRARARRHAGAHPHQNANRRRPRAQALPRAEHPLLNVLAMPLQLHGSCETRRAAGAARVCACSCARALVACDRCSASLRGGLIHAHDRYDDRRDRERYDDRHRDRYSRRRSQSRSRSRSCSRPHCAYLPASAFEAAAHWLRFLPSGRPGGGRATRGVKTSASAASL